MCKMIPNIVIDFHGSLGEKRVYEALKSLPDDYTVFYSLSWNKKTNNSVHWGEADFAVFNRKKGILFIEVKSGGIEYKDGQWYQTRIDNGNVNFMKDPVVQANKSKFHFIDVIYDQLGNTNCHIDVAVWFPSIKKSDSIGDMPANLKKEMILDENSLQNCEKSLDLVYDFYNSKEHTNISEAIENKIIKILAPYYQAIPSMILNKEERDYQFLKLTNEQNNLLDYLEEQKSAAIQGGAGTGKTLLAMEKARRLSGEEKVLFLCFNSMLANFLRNNNLNENIDIYTIDGLTSKFLNRSIVNDEDIIKFLNNYDRYNFNYKNIIVDEGQDFNPECLELLSDITNINNGCFYVFYDNNQLIQNFKVSNWLLTAECKLNLTYNCRNTREIAITSNKLVGIELKKKERMVFGEKPYIHFLDDIEILKINLGRNITELLKKGYKDKEIVIITMKTIETSILAGQTKLGKFNITNNFDRNNDILFTTVRKFKGLEADCVIMIDLDETIFIDDIKKRLFYVGASRAKHNLDLYIYNKNANINIIENIINKDPRLNIYARIAKHIDCNPIINN